MYQWTKSRAQKWCWKFIINNKRFPTVNDFEISSDSSKAPSSGFVHDNFQSVHELIENCGPTGGTNIGIPPKFKDLRASFDRFFMENGHYPSASEIDLCDYFISSRSIQRSWGGLANLRKLMGMDIVNYGSGKIRSLTAERIGKRSFKEEQDFEKILVNKFGEIFVHTQKRIGNINVDFFIYSPSLNFGVDVFNYERDHDLKGIINIKQKTYASFPFTIIFLPMNSKKSQQEIDEILMKKDKPLPEHCKVLTIDKFGEWINSLSVYKDPTK